MNKFILFAEKNKSTLLLVGISILLTLQIRGLFDKKQVDAKVIEAQVKLKQYETELPVIRKELDAIYEKYDSLLLASIQRYENLEQQKTPIRNAIKQVPFVVGNFDKEQLRRAVANY